MIIKDGVLLRVTNEECSDGHITIPDGVTRIGFEAFYNCTSLASITIPDSVTSIGEEAFSHCRSLTSVNIPDRVTRIGNFAFEYCTALLSVTIGNSVTSIGYAAFLYCTSLTSVNISDSVTYIGWYAFRGCANLTSPKNNYKAFKSNMTCRGYQYKVGEWSEPIDNIRICLRGYHFCTNLFDVFNYYYGALDKNIKIAVCEIGDKIETDGNDSKHVTNTIKPVRILSKKEILSLLNGRFYD